MKLDWYPQQDADATWLAGMDNGLLLLDPRVGKTPVALVAAARRGVRRIAVLTGAVVKEQWRRMQRTWAPDLEMKLESYDRLSRNPAVLRNLLAFAPEVVIEDEGQRCKNPASKRTKAVYGRYCDTIGGLTEGAGATWVLSGTLAPNHLGETWTHLHAMGRTRLRYMPFLHYFCEVWESPYGPVVKGPRKEHLAEYRALIAPIALRRRFREVFPAHQPPRWTTIPLSLDGKALTTLRGIERDLTLQAVRKELARATTVEEKERILAAARPHTASIRERLSEVKAPLVAEEAAELLNGGVEKLVVFAIHTSMIRLLAQLLRPYGVVVLEGATPEAQRIQHIDRFAEDPICRVCICQTETASEGIPLHAARVMMIAELPWSLGRVIQLVNRIVSKERPDAPEVLLAALAGTIDEDVAETIRLKVQHVRILDSLSQE